MTELAYNSFVNRSTSINPFEIVIGYHFWKQIDIVELPAESRPNEFAQWLVAYACSTWRYLKKINW